MAIPAKTVKWGSAAAAAAALAIVLHWAVTQPAMAKLPALGTPLFVQVVLGAEFLKPAAPVWYTALNAAIAALTISGACGLALLILIRTSLTPATRRLAAALALASFAAAYFYFARMYPQYREWMRLDVRAWKFVLDACVYMAAMSAAYLLMRFFMSYPREPTDEEWLSHYRKHVEEVRANLSSGWRRWLYPRFILRWQETRGAKAGWREKLTDIGPTSRAKVRRFFVSWWPLGICAVLAVYFAFVDGHGAAVAASGAARESPPYRLAVNLESMGFPLGMLAIVYMVATGFEGLKFHHQEAVAGDRAKIDWIYGSMMVFGLLAASLSPIWWAVSLMMLPWLEASSIVISPVLLIAGPMVLGMQLFLLAFVASLAFSIFYRGAIDPRLAARRITFFGLMSIIVTLLFVFIERAVASKVVAWLGAPPESGLVIAGAVVAATFSPIRARTEKAANIFIARFLPLDSLMEGERMVAAVVLSDLSGYTALSDRDEKQALLVAALLQRQAHMVADEYDGRVVKSMGDAVVMTFHDALAAAKALAALHGRFGGAAKALGLTPLEVHSGAHIGEITETADGDIYGQTVNIAARLQSLAQPGQRVASEIFANSANLGETSRRSLGLHKLKNVAEPMPCVELS